MHADIQNVFTPALAIDSADRFAGRQEQLDRISLALQSDGTQIVIYGNRGVGKSSLARQLEGLARGDTSVIDRLKLPPHKTPDYLVISIECDDTIENVDSLILRILTEDTALAPWIPFRIQKSTTGSEAGGSLNVKVFSASAKLSDGNTAERPALEQDIHAVFGNAINHILDSKVVSGILFIIDEVDRIKQRDDLASIIRSRGADPRAKFCLIGVGTTPQELILNHESIVRQLAEGCVEMPPMSRGELKEIFARAHEVLKDDGISFSEEAQDWIIDIAKGHPFYVHLLGKYSLINALMKSVTLIDRDLAQQVLIEIANKGTATVQEATYQKAIGHSYTREFIVKMLAAESTEEINTSAVYPKIAQGRGMDANAISVYVGQLVSEKYGSIIEKTRERHYRFKDSLFKAYAEARPYKLRSEQVEIDTTE